MKIQKKSNVTLATTKSVPSVKIDDYTYWIYGKPGIGKSTFVNALFSKVHNFMFDDGAKAMSVYKKQITQWPDFVQLVNLIAAGDHDYTGSCTDLVETAYNMCYDYVCKNEGWSSPEEGGYGKGWKMLRDEYMGVMMKLMTIPGVGCTFISLASVAERKTWDGDVMLDVHPALTGKILESLSGAVDVIGYYHYKKSKPTLQIRGDDDVMAKVRNNDQFLYTDGTPIKFIDMGTSPKQAAENFVKAFNNQLPPPPPEEKKVLKQLKK